MAQYQKLGRQMITPLNMNGWAFEVARQNYAKYSGLDFGQDLLYYMQHGYVWSWPDFFMMAKPIERDGKRGWFVQMLVGNLGQLLAVIPCPLDFVAFCRNNDENMRVIDFEKCCRMAARVHGFYRKEVKQ
jgi:hypothetical protein